MISGESLVVSAVMRLNPKLQAHAFDALLTRAEWTRALLEAVQQGDVLAVLSALGSVSFMLATRPVRAGAT